MGKYRVVVERSERISFLIDATSAEDAEERYLMDGDEDWSKTFDTVVTGVEAIPDEAAEERADAVLVQELRAANPKEFGRPAVPSIYGDYKALADAAPNGLVYNADAKAYFTDRHEIPADLERHLDHEIYLASGQYRLAQMVAKEEAAREEGWVAITEIEPADGLMLESQTLRGGPFRVKPTGQPGAPWALLPKGKRTNGLNFTRMVEQHQSYLDAKERGQVAQDGPAVYMVRIVKKGN